MTCSLMFAMYMPQVYNIGERRQLIRKNKCEKNDKRKKTMTEIFLVGNLYLTAFTWNFYKMCCTVRWQEKIMPKFRSNNLFSIECSEALLSFTQNNNYTVKHNYFTVNWVQWIGIFMKHDLCCILGKLHEARLHLLPKPEDSKVVQGLCGPPR